MSGENSADIPRYPLGHTVTVTDETRDIDDELYDPNSGVKITIISPDGTKVVDDQAMTNDDTGKWSYLWESSDSDEEGFYTVRTVARDGSKDFKKQNQQAFEMYEEE